MVALIDGQMVAGIVMLCVFGAVGIATGIGIIETWRSPEGRLRKLVEERAIKKEERDRRTRLLDRIENQNSPLAELYKINIAFIEIEIEELDVRIEALRCEIEMKRLEKR